MAIGVSSDTLSSLGRAAHDVGLAALLGGNLYGRVGMHPSLAEVSDKAERGRALNRAWRRYAWVNSLSLGAIVAGWAAPGSPRRGRRTSRLASGTWRGPRTWRWAPWWSPA